MTLAWALPSAPGMVIEGLPSSTPTHGASRTAPAPSSALLEFLPSLGAALARRMVEEWRVPGRGHVTLGQVTARIPNHQSLELQGLYEEVDVMNHFVRRPTGGSVSLRYGVTSWADLASLVANALEERFPSHFRDKDGAALVLGVIGQGLLAAHYPALVKRYEQDLGRSLGPKEWVAHMGLKVDGGQPGRLELDFDLGAGDQRKIDTLPDRRYRFSVPLESVHHFLELTRFIEHCGFLEGGLARPEIEDLLPLVKAMTARGTLTPDTRPRVAPGPTPYAPPPAASRADPRPKGPGATLVSVRLPE